MQERNRGERQRPFNDEDRFNGDAAGERGYRGDEPHDTPPGSVPGGSYGAGGGYSQGGFDTGNYDPALEEYAARRRRPTARPRPRRRPQRGPQEYGASGRGGYGPEGLGASRDYEAEFERGDWEGAGEWHGRARPAGPSGFDPDDYQDTGYGEARGGHWGAAFGGSAGSPADGLRPGQRGPEESGRGWNGGFAPEGSWHGGGEPWSQPGPHTGRGPEGYRRSGDAIREDVCERLTRHGQLDASGITVRVEEGEVILEGTVDSRRAKRLAEDAAESVSGVHDVQNRLRVSRGD